MTNYAGRVLGVHPVSSWTSEQSAHASQVLAAQLLLDSVRGYNAMADFAPLCPTFAAAEDAAAADLPALLSLQWSNCVATLRSTPFDAGQRARICIGRALCFASIATSRHTGHALFYIFRSP